MQTTNRRLRRGRRQGALNYVANGEIGVAIGDRDPAPRRRRSACSSTSSSPPSPASSYSYWPTDGDQTSCSNWPGPSRCTSRKARSSASTFLVLPARANVSRELMYTALTRQKDKVVILHEGTLEDLRDLAQPMAFGDRAPAHRPVRRRRSRSPSRSAERRGVRPQAHARRRQRHPHGLARTR